MNDNKDYKTEVLIKLTRMETTLESFKITVEKALENLKETERRSIEALNLAKDNGKRIDRMEDNTRWIFRTAVGSVITGLIAILLSFIR